VANFCRSWSFYLLINSQAEYFREALDYNVGKVRERQTERTFHNGDTARDVPTFDHSFA
jgi:hypothetical protein